ncbi:hypothetical protein MTBUT4_250009 [Magnetospirillum sp. UT-4]|nr:hypothetical protein MTBUT4_250009 [Magnetospirillum sp. UT-4]
MKTGKGRGNAALFVWRMKERRGHAPPTLARLRERVRGAAERERACVRMCPPVGSHGRRPGPPPPGKRARPVPPIRHRRARPGDP